MERYRHSVWMRIYHAPAEEARVLSFMEGAFSSWTISENLEFGY
ncbi:hypothetical protein BRO54_0436 [Geobacillus proteiniphilus]|uniref:Uncharacterized protein n=1 Tax=Geobacillus proteiniphilus TaxID=860353 RepID=A0A1Q5T7Q8_9BACL|nr:hypothetical protein BRO54_0436 [Geobacillus proteiniphilus]